MKRSLINAVLALLMVNAVPSGAVAQQPTLSDKLNMLFVCGAVFFVKAADNPGVLNVDRDALQLRDLFTDMGVKLYDSQFGGAVSDEQIGQFLSDKLRLLETQHRQNGDPAFFAALCYATGDSIFAYAAQQGASSQLASMPARQFVHFFESWLPPKDNIIDQTFRQMRQEEIEAFRESYGIWARRGYCNPEKAKRLACVP